MKKFPILIIILFIITAVLIIAFSLSLGSSVGGDDDDDENDDSIEIQHTTYFWLYICFLFSMFSLISIFIINDNIDFLDQAIFKIRKG